ncbi:MAG: indolepyruvate ferredoxin oxidoreductase [Deltaproteobacteria bacterium]|nr:indolepyruvate ferredoxin oxidoreductase [Deltaproteobacteria bacterium]MBW2085536.1 indolepyruvate ferredoxin oxidoreductase [Deltaproteobacteria bacterium]
MSVMLDGKEGMEYMVMGNEAIVRGALEAGLKVASGYPGTPSSEIIERLSDVAKDAGIYVEWSVNEKVAAEVAAAASFAQLRSLASMKQVGVNVASDFLLHLAITGTRGGMVLVTCEDPAAHSSSNEGDSRGYARMMEFPLLEPGDFQEAKDMTKWAFEFSEEIGNLVMVRSVTRLSHASGNVKFGPLPRTEAQAEYRFSGAFLDPVAGPMISTGFGHRIQQEKLKKVREIFEDSPFNTYQGPDEPELLIITCSVGNLYCKEAIKALGIEDRVGLLKMGTTWPLPPNLIKKYLLMTDEILIIEEILPFLEDNVKVLAAEMVQEIGAKKFYGKHAGQIPSFGELSADLVIQSLADLLDLGYETVAQEYTDKASAAAFARAPQRELTFCPGCPHRASFWAIHNALELDGRQGFVCGDIGCYSLAALPTGFSTAKTGHAMGSGAGVASGFAKLRQFGMDQPVLAVCGDSTFFHAAIPALVNAVHHQADFTLIVLDNSGTAMTGFQSHPGLNINAMKDEVPALDIPAICQAMGARVEVRDPFDLEETQKTLNELMEYTEGTKVLVLKQACALSPEKKRVKSYNMQINEENCIGQDCGCNRLCTRIFRCPGLIWDEVKKVARIDEVICAGCGVCADICPAGAIVREEA